MFIENQTTKFIPVSATAAAATFGIFFLMQGLIANDVVDLQEPITRIWIDNIAVPEQKPKIRQIERVKPPEAVVPEPETTDPRTTAGEPDIFTPGPTEVPKFVTPDFGADMLAQTDGERVPIVRVNPVYPRSALERGIEGWVVVEFTVNHLGAVESPVVIDAEPANIFNKAALKAVEKFKYKPTIVDGQPRASKGVRFRMTFSLTE